MFCQDFRTHLLYNATGRICVRLPNVYMNCWLFLQMVFSNTQKLKHEEDDDEDLETLRLAALKSLRAKNTLQSTQQPAVLPQPAMPRVAYPHGPVYNHRGTSKRGYYQNRLPRPNRVSEQQTKFLDKNQWI